MMYLIAGSVVFFGAHAFPWFPDMRSAVIAKLGMLGYRGVFALVSGIGFALLVYGYGTSERTILWSAPEAARTLAYIGVPLAHVLVAAAYLGSNIKRLTAHPMLWGVGIWALVHLINNGDLESLILFGGFLAYAVLAATSANRRGTVTSPRSLPVWRDAVVLAIGVIAAGAIAHFHQTLFGVAVV